MKSMLIAAVITLGLSNLASAGPCQGLLIAAYSGPAKTFEQIYAGQAGKFWLTDMSGYRLAVDKKFKTAAPLPQLNFYLRPKDQTVWLSPFIQAGGQDCAKVGKLIDKEDKGSDAKSAVFKDLLMHASIDVALHFLFR